MRAARALFAAALAVTVTSAQAAGRQPNIVHIVVDDLGWKDVGFNGCTDIKTPNIDKLAAGGARVPRVDLRVDQPVEGHRQRAGADHRHRDPDEIVRARHSVDRQQRADVREREREDGVLDLDERREAAQVGGEDAHSQVCL